MEKQVFPGRTEVEQLHRIFKLCGSPSEKFWKKSKLRYATIVRPKQHYTRCIGETFKELSPSSLLLIDSLLALDPADRGRATTALNHEFFTTEPYACDPSSLPQYSPSKEMDAKLRAVPAPEANAELQINLERMRLMIRINMTSKSEKFPPLDRDGVVGVPSNGPMSFAAPNTSFTSSVFEAKEYSGRGSIANDGTGKTSASKEELRMEVHGLRRLLEIKRNRIVHGTKRKELETLGSVKQ